MYIIDEFIKIIELFKKHKNKIKIITIAKYYLIENAFIIQKYSINNDKTKLVEALINNFDKLYNLIINDKELIKDSLYYDNLKYIFLKEFKKVSDINYRCQILNKLLKEKEIIIRSGDIFEIICQNYLKNDENYYEINKLFEEKNIILETLEKNLKNNNYILENVLLYVLEEKCLKYFIGIFHERNKSVCKDDKSIELLKVCIAFLTTYIMSQENKEIELNELVKLFCIGYIKAFSYELINSVNDNSSKYEEYEKIIDIFNGKEPIYKMIRMFIYKIIFKKNDVNIDKYQLNKYIDFKDFIIAINQINKIYYKIKTIKNEYFDNSCQIINRYENEKFDDKIDINVFNIKEYGIDNFYISTYNSTLSHLNVEKNLDVNKQLYIKINENIFEEKKLLLNAIKLFYEQEKYNMIKNLYKINSTNIKPLLIGYRYCLNEIFSENKEGIYYPLYEKDNNNFIKNNYFPGNDTKYSIIHNDIYNHFKLNPEEGCYICLCEELYYHSVSSGFPGFFELNMKCPKCFENIGSYYESNEVRKIKIVKRDNYFRIFKDLEEIEKLKKIKK